MIDVRLQGGGPTCTVLRRSPTFRRCLTERGRGPRPLRGESSFWRDRGKHCISEPIVPPRKIPLDHPIAIDPDDLELDRRNPRFGGEDVAPGKKGELTIIKRLHEQADLMELVESIAANGYIDLEPLFMVEETGKKVVVEGNRRVAAIKVLKDPILARSAGIAIPEMSEATVATFDRVHVIKLGSRDEARQLIGFKHINGTHKWDSYAKARFAAEWYRKEKKKGTTLEDIARSLGDRHDTVQRLVQGIFVLDQARAAGLFDQEGRFPGRVFFFSHLYTALTRPEYRQFLGLPERWRDSSPKDHPVPKGNHEQLKELLNWLYGSKEDDEQPVIASQNPDVKLLGEVLASPQALKRLRANRDLKAAYEYSGARSRQFSDYLIKALTQAEKASGLMSAYVHDATLLESAEALVEVSRLIVTNMNLKRKDLE